MKINIKYRDWYFFLNFLHYVIKEITLPIAQEGHSH